MVRWKMRFKTHFTPALFSTKCIFREKINYFSEFSIVSENPEGKWKTNYVGVWEKYFKYCFKCWVPFKSLGPGANEAYFTCKMRYLGLAMVLIELT